MATVKAFIRSSKDKEVNLRFRLSDGRDIQLFHTSEILVIPNTWDAKEQALKKRILYNTQERNNLNKWVNDRKALILKVYSERLDSETVSSKWLDLAIDKELNPQKYKEKQIINTLFKYVDKFIEEAPNRKDKATGKLLTFNNIQQYKATAKHLKAYASMIGCDDFSFEEINQSFNDGFVNYLQSEIIETDNNGKALLDENNQPILRKKSFTANSVGKHIRILKLMLNEATTAGYNKTTTYSNFHVFSEDIDSIYLSEEELTKLKKYDFSKHPYLEHTRDWFLLLAWTGSRFSDLERITHDNIKDGFITFRQQKTNNKVTIPLHPVVKEILDKYKYHLPKAISNQKFNDYIKEVGKIAGIDNKESVTITRGGKRITESYFKWELISSHAGRRSFCTNMYKRGLPTLMIMSISGHKTEKSFLKYIKVKHEEHAQMMAKAWKNMYK